jgi:hypothetical protein
MSQFVTEDRAQYAYINGKYIGGIKPCAEMKWTGWYVVVSEDEIIACVIDRDNWVSCGTIITLQELHLYVDDIEAAQRALSSSIQD